MRGTTGHVDQTITTRGGCTNKQPGDLSDNESDRAIPDVVSNDFVPALIAAPALAPATLGVSNALDLAAPGVTTPGVSAFSGADDLLHVTRGLKRAASRDLNGCGGSGSLSIQLHCNDSG